MTGKEEEMPHFDERLARLRLFCAATLPANYQSIQADIEALLREYDRRVAGWTPG